MAVSDFCFFERITFKTHRAPHNFSKYMMKTLPALVRLLQMLKSDTTSTVKYV